MARSAGQRPDGRGGKSRDLASALHSWKDPHPAKSASNDECSCGQVAAVEAVMPHFRQLSYLGLSDNPLITAEAKQHVQSVAPCDVRL